MKKEYYLKHREEIIAKVSKYQISYRNTPMGRCVRLCNNHKNADKKANRDEGDLTAKWIYDNIIFKPCAHCGKTGWQIIGCNRIDNSKPHTKDNVEPCCEECNRKLYYEEHKRKFDQIDNSTGEVLKTWGSISECSKQTNIGYGVVSQCYNKKYLRDGNNVYKNYIFKKIC